MIMAIEIILAALVVLAVALPMVDIQEKWTKEMDETNERK